MTCPRCQSGDLYGKARAGVAWIVCSACGHVWRAGGYIGKCPTSRKGE